MTLNQIESIIREVHGGAWWALFHLSGEGFLFLPTGHKLTARAYGEIKRRFGAVGSDHLTKEERMRNRLRWKADQA